MKKMGLFLLVFLCFVFLSCSEDDPCAEYVIDIISPVSGETVSGLLKVEASFYPEVDSLVFVFAGLRSVNRGSYQRYTYFDLSGFEGQSSNVKVEAHWEDYKKTKTVSFLIARYECDPTGEVIIGGMTIPEDRLLYDEDGCLIEIDISGMGISSPLVLQGISNYCVKLEKLILSNNDLTAIVLDEIETCQRLEHLIISGNGIFDFDLSKLRFNRNLKSINLRNNEIQVMNTTGLVMLTKLKWLSLDNNSLEHIDLSWLSYGDSLQSVSISNNSLNSIDLEFAENSTELLSLSFDRNNIDEVDLSPLSQNTALTTLSLHSNNIETIDLDPLSNNHSISWLYFERNRIASIDFGPLMDKASLMELLIHRNNLDSLSCISFCEFVANQPHCRVSSDCSCP